MIENGPAAPPPPPPPPPPPVTTGTPLHETSDIERIESGWERTGVDTAEHAWPSQPSGSQVLVAHVVWFGMFVVASGLASVARMSASNYDFVLGVTAAQFIVSAVALVIAASMVSRSSERAAASWASGAMVVVGVLVLTYASGLSDWTTRLGWAVLSALTAFMWIVSRRRRGVVCVAAVAAMPLDLAVGYSSSELYVGGYDVGSSILILLPMVIASWVAVVWDRVLDPGDPRPAARTVGHAPAVTVNTAGIDTASHLAKTYTPAVSTYGAGVNGLATASLITGILGMGVVAVVLGHIARNQIARTGEQGAGQALAGLILGYIALAVWVALILAWVSFISALSAL